MKRFAFVLCAALGVVLSGSMVRAECGGLCYGGQQPCWNIFNRKNKQLTCEEQRLNRFWHDYYDALKKYYALLDHIDWVAYYKNHGYQINAGCGGPGNPCQVNYAPVFVTPTMQWAVPHGCLSGPPMGGCA